MHPFRTISTVLFLAIVPLSSALATDYVIPTSQEIVADTITSPHPGDRYIIDGGHRGRISFIGIYGTPDSFVTIINNADSTAIIDADSAASGFYMKNCRYVNVTGTGRAGDNYGIRVTRTKTYAVAAYKCSDITFDHLEIDHCTGIGITPKTDYLESDPDTWRENFTQYNTVIHDLYIHDVGTEGMYVGSSYWALGLSPVLNGVSIYDNIVENTGSDGIQVGSAIANVSVHDNTISNTGTSNRVEQNFGIVINNGTVGSWYNNIVSGAMYAGVYVGGIGPYQFYNNIIENSGYVGVLWHRGIGDVFNNSIVSSGAEGVYVSEDVNGAARLVNNIVAGYPAGYDPVLSYSDSCVVAYNSTSQLVSGMYFLDAGSSDYHLTADSPAVDAGTLDCYAATDLDGKSRPIGSRPDCGAYEYRPSSGGSGGNTPGVGLRIRAFTNPQGKTEFSFALARTGNAKLSIFDLRGRLVRRQDLGVLGAGSHSVPWDGLAVGGERCATGVYFARLTAGQEIATCRVVLVR